MNFHKNEKQFREFITVILLKIFWRLPRIKLLLY